MSFELLFDPLFRVPFATGLLLAGILPLIGMYLRLRNEWLAALAFAQMASAGALVAMVLDGPMLAGGVLAALLAALIKGLLARAGASAYALMMLLAWGGGVLLVANHPLAEQAGHALFDGQLYFTGEAHLADWLGRAHGGQGIVLVSHDHAFIDQVCTRVVEVGA